MGSCFTSSSSSKNKSAQSGDISNDAKQAMMEDMKMKMEYLQGKNESQKDNVESKIAINEIKKKDGKPPIVLPQEKQKLYEIKQPSQEIKCRRIEEEADAQKQRQSNENVLKTTKFLCKQCTEKTLKTVFSGDMCKKCTGYGIIFGSQKAPCSRCIYNKNEGFEIYFCEECNGFGLHPKQVTLQKEYSKNIMENHYNQTREQFKLTSILHEACFHYCFSRIILPVQSSYCGKCKGFGVIWKDDKISPGKCNYLSCTSFKDAKGKVIACEKCKGMGC